MKIEVNLDCNLEVETDSWSARPMGQKYNFCSIINLKSLYTVDFFWFSYILIYINEIKYITWLLISPTWPFQWQNTTYENNALVGIWLSHHKDIQK